MVLIGDGGDGGVGGSTRLDDLLSGRSPPLVDESHAPVHVVRPNLAKTDGKI